MKSPSHYSEKYKHMFMSMAEDCSKASVAKRLQVGCVIYLNNHTLTTGWNGMPSGSQTEICEDIDGNTKADVHHAEQNAIKKLQDSGMLHLAKGGICFVTHQPCSVCAASLISIGITCVYYKNIYRCDSGINLLKQNNINVYQFGE